MSFLKAYVSPLCVISACLVATVAIAPARAAYEAQAAETKAFAEKALAMYKAKGPVAAKADFLASKEWLLGPDHFNLHIGGFTKALVIWADTAFPDLNGTSLNDLDDFDGVSVGKSVTNALAKSPDGGSVQLRFSNPATKAVAHSEGWCLYADPDNVICAWSESN